MDGVGKRKCELRDPGSSLSPLHADSYCGEQTDRMDSNQSNRSLLFVKSPCAVDSARDVSELPHSVPKSTL